jgi:hypothetical protein
VGESNNTGETAQLLNIIRSITESFKVIEELPSPWRLHGTTGEDILWSVCGTMKEPELPWTILKEVTKDWAVWLERKQVWCKEWEEKWTNKVSNFTRNSAASSTSNYFVPALRSLNRLWKLWCWLWTSFDLRKLNHRQFPFFYWKLMLIMRTSCTIQKSDG